MRSMELTFSAEVEAFRADFIAFLDEHLPDELAAAQRSRSTSHLPRLGASVAAPAVRPRLAVAGQSAGIRRPRCRRSAAVRVPGRTRRRRIYHSFNPQGVGIIAASLLTFGTDEQKRRWAVPILRAELTASLGMSEPGAGSDLAGLRSRAVRHGDHFVVNGHKLWTSGAHDADVLLTFVRTDPDAPKHRGISALLIARDTPGVLCRPFPAVYDRDNLDFNEVFLTDVRVPAENLVGPLNGGWQVANGSLMHERTLMWMAFADRLRDLLEDFRPVRAVDRDRYATIAMDTQALRLLGSAAVARAASGEANGAGMSVLKLLGSEAEQNAANCALDAAGLDGLVDPMTTAPYNPYRPDLFTASWFARYIGTFAGTTAGGTSEIQRNIIAERLLGLPRS